jgi:hypothetical protein
MAQQKDAAEVAPRTPRNLGKAKSKTTATEAVEKANSVRVSKKLKPEDYQIADDVQAPWIGLDTSARRRIPWQSGELHNLLLAGYGVRQTEWLIAGLLRHFKEHKVPRVGLDFSSFLADYGKGLFSELYTSRERAEEIFDRYAGASEPVALFITAGGNMLAPLYVAEDLQAVAKRTSERLAEKLLVLLRNPNVYVIFASSRLHESEALPQVLLPEFETIVLTSKVFARDVQYTVPEGQQENAGKLSELMRPTQNILLTRGERGEIFDNFRVPLR